MELALEAVQHNARWGENPQNCLYIDNMTETAAPATALRVRSQMKRDQLRHTIATTLDWVLPKIQNRPFSGPPFYTKR